MKESNIPVLYEDDWLLIVDKPSGLLTIPTPKNESRTLTSILNADLKNKGLSYRLHPCHRLDRETSGLIIYAKGKSAQKKMMELFKQKKIKKTYIAFVQGKLPLDRGDIGYPIDGRNALTEYRVLEIRKNFSVLKITPLTGRTNQIRIHFKYIGHPLVGETKFAFRKDYKLKAKRLCLHAAHLSFVHPIAQKTISINCNLAKDLEDFLKTHTD
jgi:23S rRNA pseudouridine1911/1915/1917 synthase